MKRLLAVTALISLTTTVVAAPDLLQSLGASSADASNHVVWSITSGSVSFPPLRSAFIKAAPAARAAMADQALAWTKAFVMSPEFDRLYAAARDEAKPSAPDARGSIDAELKKRQSEHDAEMAEMKKNVATLPAEVRKEAEKALRDAEAAWNEQKKDPEFQSQLRQQLEAERGDEQQHYAEELQRWKDEYPASGRALVAKRIREFLDESSAVDYDAKLVRSGAKMKFADPDYEARSAEWKMCFRAGREPVERARAFAAAWVKELK